MTEEQERTMMVDNAVSLAHRASRLTPRREERLEQGAPTPRRSSPPSTAGRWLTTGSAKRSITPPTAPPFGSAAP